LDENQIRQTTAVPSLLSTDAQSRARSLNDAIDPGSGPIVYWMSRDQRVRDNHGLAAAAEFAAALDAPLLVAFCLRRSCGAASLRSYEFMLGGLREVHADLKTLGIGFELLLGDADELLPKLGPRVVVCDFSPLNRSRGQRDRLAGSLRCPLIEVDSRNIVPAWVAADKHVYAAFHLRNRYRELLPRFLTDLPEIVDVNGAETADPDWQAAAVWIAAEEHGPALSISPGERAAGVALDDFIEHRLAGYDELRGRPESDHQSGLSPYLHFGQLSIQRAALAVRSSDAPTSDIESFIDEAVVWRELSDNFCLNKPEYAGVGGFADWARATLDDHTGDAREVIYDLDAFEQADTHDPIWNAAQLEMVRTGKMHNYMRMYWAKKILEWSESPSEAMRIAVLLNDRYELDGRDSNGYAGIAWSIGGVHDRPWQERSVYGKIRYMNDRGARRKFDVDAYIRRVAPELLDEQLF
jgi:deoxyribodipyrimidine photo-lyase